ncbi:MAG: HEAT repeat domain-containing protein [Planctomycetes bacterium]|nr:HEAT repeat domain-containing protein [Planctomycetota bacterium]
MASSTDSPEETVDDLGPTPLDDLSEVTDDEASEAVRAASLARDSDDDLGPGVDEDREAPGEEDAQEGEGAGPAAGDPRRRGRRRGRGRGRGREGRDGRDGREFDLEERRGGGGSGHQAQSDPATYLPLEQSPRADLLAGIETIQTRRDAGGIDLLDRLVSRTGDPELRLVAIRALGEVGHSRGLAPLVRCLEDADEGVVREAARGIGLILYYRDREFYQTDNLAFLVLNYLH